MEALAVAGGVAVVECGGSQKPGRARMDLPLPLIAVIFALLAGSVFGAAFTLRRSRELGWRGFATMAGASAPVALVVFGLARWITVDRLAMQVFFAELFR